MKQLYLVAIAMLSLFVLTPIQGHSEDLQDPAEMIKVSKQIKDEATARQKNAHPDALSAIESPKEKNGLKHIDEAKEMKDKIVKAVYNK